MLLENLTVFITVFNEESRIFDAVKRFKVWCNRVVVLNKESTDSTEEVALKAGARVVQIPFVEAGNFDGKILIDHCETDWFIWLTPSDQLSLGLVLFLIDALPRLDPKTDVLALPVKLYSFGSHVHREKGPWSISFQPRLLNRLNVKPVDIIHQHWAFTKNSLKVPYTSEIFIAHCTHVSLDKFIKTHADYAKVSANQSNDKITCLHQALFDAERFDHLFNLEGESGLKYKLAWKVYNYMIVLNLLVPDEVSVRDTYKNLLNEMTDEFRLHVHRNL